MKPLISQIDGLPEELLSKIDKSLLDFTKDPTGFTDPANTVVSYDSTTRKITLSGLVQAVWRGTVVTPLVNGWVSDAHNDVNGTWFLYYNGTTFVWSQTTWTLDMLMIAFINYGAVDKYGLKECHGLMPWLAHKSFHEKIGTSIKSGGDLSGLVLSSTTLADRRPTISQCLINDEDIDSTLSNLVPASLYTRLELTGSGTVSFVKNSNDIVNLSGSRPYYNQFTGGNWVQTLMSNNNYQALWLLAIPTTYDSESQKYRFIWIQGQSQSAALGTIQGLIPSNINLGNLSNQATEFVFIGKVIIQYTGANWTIVQVDKLTGTKYNQTSIPVGSYLSAVSTDNTLLGEGTVANPLRVNTDSISGVIFWTTLIDGATITAGQSVNYNSILYFCKTTHSVGSPKTFDLTKFDREGDDKANKSNPVFQDGTDTNKKVSLDISGVTSGQTRSLKIPDKNLDLGNATIGQIGIKIEGNGGIIQPGQYGGYVVIPYTGIITGWQLYEGSSTPQSSTCVLDVWKKSSFYPTVADTIFGTKPSLTASTNSSATGLNIAVSAGDIFTFNVDSNAGALVLTLSLTIVKN